MEGRGNKKKTEGQKGRRNSGGKEKRKKKKKKNKKVFCWLEIGQVSSAGRPVCGMGGGVWKDWSHFSPFLSHTLRCCSASSPVPQGPSAPH